MTAQLDLGDAPPPPYPATTAAKGWRLELDHGRITESDTWALASPEQRPWLLMIWMVAWRQTPCASLPDDDRIIASRLGMPLIDWMRNREILLRGWARASDGRLYHQTLTEFVLAMLAKRQSRGYLRLRDAVIEQWGNRCIYCGATDLPLTLDHVVPRSRGGPDTIDNLVPACLPCNCAKGARTPSEWGVPP